ncbi:MAG: hydrogenase 3 maturation endopeptidase HyCI [Candidatus Bathyarchaeota archaeon]|nr:MAG: hydrogenase 3 maturation endopeptidase HyCI [Candidatus Bathyarchaeota archaeon]
MNDFRKRDDNEIEPELLEWLSGVHRIVVAGIGNPLRRDDFVGVKIVKDLQGISSSSVYLIECDTVPENYMEPIISFQPSHILIIDAALLKLKPGSAKLLNSKQLMKQHAVSTHLLPLRIFCEYLERETKAKIALLLIQPKDANFGEGLTREVQNTADYMAKLLLQLLPV